MIPRTIPQTIYQHYIHKDTIKKVEKSQLEKTTEKIEPQKQTINEKYAKRHYPQFSRYIPERKNLKI